jgi:hypothetical protein
MNNFDIEQNSRKEQLVSFKAAFGSAMANVEEILAKFCPEMDEGERKRVIYVFFPFMFGIYPYTAVTDKQSFAMAAAGMDFAYQTVYELCHACLTRLIG